MELFSRYDSLYRFLLKGTAANPDDRFQSADEMADQLHGVLREIVAAEESRPVPGVSSLFTFALRAGLERPDWRILPRPQVAAEDPAAAFLAAITGTDPAQLIAQLQAAPDHTVEVDFRLIVTSIEAGDLAGAQEMIAAIESADPWEWRAHWYRGLAALASGDATAARRSFGAVYETLPGELAPKQALALACESGGDHADRGRPLVRDRRPHRPIDHERVVRPGAVPAERRRPRGRDRRLRTGA